jgi:hypothetical protein
MNKQYRLKKDINKNIQFKRTKRVGSLGRSDKIQPFNIHLSHFWNHVKKRGRKRESNNSAAYDARDHGTTRTGRHHDRSQ